MIEFLSSHLLSIILLSPVAGALLVMLVPAKQDRAVRWAAFLVSLVPFGFSIWLWSAYDASVPGYQFVEQAVWYSAIGSSYHLGVDGISVPMVVLTTLLTPLALLISWSIREHVRACLALFLLLESGMLGVFLSLDLLMFFVFWEIGLVPMYFLINQWGSSNRNYASFKFLIYTMAGSLGLLLAIQLIGLASGTFNLVEITQRWTALDQPLEVGLAKGGERAGHNRHQREEGQRPGVELGFRRIQREHEAQETVRAELEQHAREDHRTGGGRFGVRVRQPRVEREDGDFDGERNRERPEGHRADRRGREAVDRPRERGPLRRRVQHVERAERDADGLDRQQQAERPGHGVDEELE